jgi:hypothetical protein
MAGDQEPSVIIGPVRGGEQLNPVSRFCYRKKEFPNWAFIHIILDYPPGYRYYMCSVSGCAESRSSMKLLKYHAQVEHKITIDTSMHVGRHQDSKFVALDWKKLVPHHNQLSKIVRSDFVYASLDRLEPLPDIRSPSLARKKRKRKHEKAQDTEAPRLTRQRIIKDLAKDQPKTKVRQRQGKLHTLIYLLSLIFRAH